MPISARRRPAPPPAPALRPGPPREEAPPEALSDHPVLLLPGQLPASPPAASRPPQPRGAAAAGGGAPCSPLPARWLLADLPAASCDRAAAARSLAAAGVLTVADLADSSGGAPKLAPKVHRELRRKAAACPSVASVTSWLRGAPGLIDSVLGDLPVVLSAPHDGRRALRSAAARDPHVHVTVRDTNSRLVALACATALRERYGRRAHLVCARADRKYCDVSRRPAIACDMGNNDARMYYFAYHMQLATCCEAAAAAAEGSGRRPLLLDVHGHGQKKGASTVYRGSMNGHSFVAQHGVPEGHGLLAALAAQGCDIVPRRHGDPEVEGYTGGWTVQSLGSALDPARGMDAVQLELGNSLRSTQSRCRRFGEALADAVALYLRLPPLGPAGSPQRSAACTAPADAASSPARL